MSTKHGQIQADASARNMLDRMGITEYLNHPGITEVMINRPFEVFTDGAEGMKRYEDTRLDLRSLEYLANTLAILNQKHLCFEQPIQSVTLPDGERGHLMMPPSCEDNTLVMCLRKPSTSRFSLNDYISSGRINQFNDVSDYAIHTMITDQNHIDGQRFRDISDKMKLPHDVYLAAWQYEMLEAKANRDMDTFFRLAVEHRLNICMVGGTGSGKTTFTKAIADLVPPQTRLITLEDTHELSLPNHPNHLHLFYKEHITAKMLIAACMRLKPDRVFLTELRGDEAWDYLSLLNTGHPGGLTSVHANDARSVHYRIAQLAKESATGQTMEYDYILNSVRATIDIVAFFSKTHLTELYFDPVAKFYAVQNK
ncbi:ATPase, T2SS/T4P/T4SS family [Neisseriaceae bacterium ESL0693]|nr:ATPase, T2SS/T4P/T4SS family [Neisseriaceae bacterium ESL0693]